MLLVRWRPARSSVMVASDCPAVVVGGVGHSLPEPTTGRTLQPWEGEEVLWSIGVGKKKSQKKMLGLGTRPKKSGDEGAEAFYLL